MLRITANDLSEISGVSVATIRRYELMDGIPSGNARANDAIQKALEQAGIEFIGTPDSGPGVRLIRT